MTTLLTFVAMVLLITVLIGLLRVYAGPRDADRMLAAQLLGTAGVGILLLLWPVLDLPGLIDTALVFASLGAVAAAALVSRPRRRQPENPS